MAVNGEEPEIGEKRLKRIRFLRKVILVSIAAACLIPTCICLILAIKYDRLSDKLDKARDELAWYESQYGDSALAEAKGDDRALEAEGAESIAEESQALAKAADAEEETAQITEVDESESGESAKTQESGSDDGELDEVSDNPDDKSEDILENADGGDNDSDGIRRVYITFDDGPSTKTNDILDVLDEYDVKASFFVTGKPDSKYSEIYQRIVNDGHTLGMHSYSHKYSELYASLTGFQTDLHQLQTFLYEITGVWSTYYRFPGGSSNTVSKVDMKELINYLALENITYYDWNVASGDDRSGITKDMIVSNVMAGVPRFENSMILLHDASDKQATVDALPEIIEQVQALDNTVIVPITEDTLPVQHISSNSQ